MGMRRLRIFIWLTAFLACALALTPTLAFAASFDFVQLESDNRPNNVFAPGWRLLVEADVTDPLGLSDILTVTAIPTMGSNLPSVTLLFSPPAFTNVNGVPTFGFDDTSDPNNLPPFANTSQQGQYRIDVTTKNSGSLTTLTHNLDNIQQIPFPTNLAVSNQSTAPIVSWTEPTGVTLPTGYELRDQLQILDPAFNGVFFSPRTSFPSGEASFQVPPGLLNVGTTYRFRSRVFETEGPNFGVDGFTLNAENRSFLQLFFTPVTVPEPPTDALLAFGLAVVLGLGLLRRGDRLPESLKAHT